MTRRTLTTIALAALLVPASGAAAVAATYEGEGTDDPKAKVRFERDSGKIKGFRVEGAKFFCTHRRPFRENMRAGPMELSENAEFQGRFTDSRGRLVLRVRGAVEGPRAHGMVRATIYFKLGHCTTGGIDWRARRADR